MTKKVIVLIASTDGMASWEQSPHLPNQPDDIALDAYNCCNIRVSVIAEHARHPDDQAMRVPRGEMSEEATA